MKKRFTLLIFLLICGSMMSFGQTVHLKRPPNPKIRSLKIKVVTKDMSLSQVQKDRFLPLYTNYSNELLVIYRKKHALRKSTNSSYVVNERMRLERQILSIKEKYKSRFLKIISPQQLEKMYQGEYRFKQLLIERLKHSH